MSSGVSIVRALTMLITEHGFTDSYFIRFLLVYQTYCSFLRRHLLIWASHVWDQQQFCLFHDKKKWTSCCLWRKPGTLCVPVSSMFTHPFSVGTIRQKVSSRPKRGSYFNRMGFGASTAILPLLFGRSKYA